MKVIGPVNWEKVRGQAPGALTFWDHPHSEVVLRYGSWATVKDRRSREGKQIPPEASLRLIEELAAEGQLDEVHRLTAKLCSDARLRGRTDERGQQLRQSMAAPFAGDVPDAGEDRPS